MQFWGVYVEGVLVEGVLVEAVPVEGLSLSHNSVSPRMQRAGEPLCQDVPAHDRLAAGRAAGHLGARGGETESSDHNQRYQLTAL